MGPAMRGWFQISQLARIVIAKAYLGYRPSKNIQGMVENIHVLTVRSGSWQDATGLVGEVEPHATDGRTTSQSEPSPSRIGRSTTTRLCGCAGGCASSTRSGDARADLSTLAPLRAFRARCACAGLGTTCVGEGVRSCPSRIWEIHQSWSDERNVETGHG
jgi:hypothetical protein